MAEQELSVRAVTWNVGELDGDYYETHMLVPLLLGEDRNKVDLVVVGLQEAEMTAGSFLSAGVSYDETPAGLKWTKTLATAFKTHRFVKLASAQLMGVYIAVFARQSIADACGDSVQLGNVGTGFMGAGFNKGGLAVRLELGGASWVLLNCHLAAGQNKASKRNDDWENITTKLTIGGHRAMDSDFIIVMGDMNYRLDCPQMRESDIREALEPIRSGAVQGREGIPQILLSSDQCAFHPCALFESRAWLGMGSRGSRRVRAEGRLTQEKEAGRVFVGFQEEPITFAPTYKYDVETDANGGIVGTDRFDTSEKQRTPSWTDRVLFRPADGISAVSGSYKPYTYLQGSDHRPVTLELRVRVPLPLPEANSRALAAERTALVPLGAPEGGMPSNFFHVAPDGSYEPYSAADNARIAAARGSGASSVRISDVALPNGTLLQFEVRFGAAARSARIRPGSPTGMMQVNLGPKRQSRIVVELPAVYGGTAALTESPPLEWELEQKHPHLPSAEAGGGGSQEGCSWIPLDPEHRLAIQEFYMSGCQLYSSVVRPEEHGGDLEIDLAKMHVRILNLDRYFHIAPDGTKEFYSPADNVLIREAVAFDYPKQALQPITLPNGAVLHFEVRFGDYAISSKVKTPPPTRMIQVNVANENTRAVDKIHDGVELLRIRQRAALPPPPELEPAGGGTEAPPPRPADWDAPPPRDDDDAVLTPRTRSMSAQAAHGHLAPDGATWVDGTMPPALAADPIRSMTW